MCKNKINRFCRLEVSYLLSYDYEMIFLSIKQLYNYVDRIVIAIDKDFKTWSGNDFIIPDSFFERIKEIDFEKKIEFYKDFFFIPTNSPIENESRERNLALKKLARGWKIQLDVDEYVYDFEELSKYLKKYWYLTLLPKFTPINFKGNLITLFKKIDKGYLYIENKEEFAFITNQSQNQFTRKNYKIRNINININVIHNSWARDNKEIINKIKNWGHRDDFDTFEYFEFWKKLNEENYKEVNDFHPTVPSVWNRLLFLECKNEEEFIRNYSKTNLQKIVKIPFSIFLKALYNKVFK